MGLTLANRLILRKVLLLRRVPHNPVTVAFLIPQVVEDERLIKEQRPDLYIDSESWGALEVLRECIEDGTVQQHPAPTDSCCPGLGHDSVSRTKLADQFIAGLEPLLAQLADEAPMDRKNLLQWLAIVS
jgi:hypothetical protein